MDSKIYTIRCRSDENLIYVGSTTQKLTQRLAKHRCSCKRGDSCSLYDYIVNDDWSDFYIELYEMYPCNSKEELLKKEGDIIRQIGTINKCIAGRTLKEYKEENAVKIKEYQNTYRVVNTEKLKENKKKYYEMNTDIIKEKIKEWRENNVNKRKEDSKKYRENNVEKIKENNKKYRENNVDKISEKRKIYYEKNAEKISEKNKEKGCCDICGAFIRKDGLTAHQKTIKCTDIASKK